MNDRSLRLGTRGSALARAQAETIQTALEAHRYTVELVEITTSGDRLREDLLHRLGTTGAFVRDIDERVLDGELDGAIHSLKDMPTEMPGDLVVAAVPERGPVNDVLVTPDGAGLAELPPDAVVGTGSLRRRAQLHRVRPEIDVRPIRGNIDTRVEQLLAGHLAREQDVLADATEEERGAWRAELTPLEVSALERDVETIFDALVLAQAGLDRAGLANAIPTESLAVDRFVPAPGQGALAVTMRDTDAAAAVQRVLDHPPSRVAATVERTILATLGGGCIAPVGVHAVVQGSVVRTRVQVLGRDGEEVIERARELPVEAHVSAAVDIAEQLADEGAKALIAESAREAGPGPDPP